MNTVKRSATALTVVLLLVMAAGTAFAASPPAVTLSDGSRIVTIDATNTVTFGGTCIVPTTCSTNYSVADTSQVVWSGKLGVFTITTVVGLANPTPEKLDLNLQSIRTTTGSGTLTIAFSETDFTDQNVTEVDSQAGGLISGTASVTLKTFADDGNVLFGTGIAAGTMGPFSSPTMSGTAQGPGPTKSPFSLTAQAVLVMGPNTNVGLDFAVTLQTGPPAPISCRMTGGGVDTNYNWDHTLADGSMITNGAGKLPPGIDRYQYGGQVGAPTASQPQPYGEWEHHQQVGPSGDFTFKSGTSDAPKGTRIVEVRCSDPGFCNPARPAPAKQLDWDGIGAFTNTGNGKNAPQFQVPDANVIPVPNGGKNKVFTYHWVQVNIDDMGEKGNLNSGAPDPNVCPGRGFGEKSAGPFVPDPVNNPSNVVSLPYTELGHCDCPDFYRITIYDGVRSDAVTYLPDGRVDPASLNKTKVIYEVFGYVDGGNLQIHPPIQ